MRIRVCAVVAGLAGLLSVSAAAQSVAPGSAVADSVTRFCGSARLPAGQGVVFGSVVARGGPLPRSLRVVAEWQELSAGKSDGRVAIEMPTRWVEARVDSTGVYHLCGAPLTTALLIRPETDSGATVNTPSLDLVIPSDRVLARADLVLDLTPTVATTATSEFTGTVLGDSTLLPIGGAEVALPDLPRRALTNDRGEFRFAGIPAGTHQVFVRHIGYGRLDARISFADGAPVDRRIMLSRAIVLDTMTVKASAYAREMRSFEDNRKVGLGRFFTKTDIAKADSAGLRLTSVLSQVLGAKVSDRYLTSSRRGCPAHVYLDNLPIYTGRRGEPLFDLRTISLHQIEAIEYYTGPAQTPMKYSTLNSQCGVLVIWTRRSR